ncbi:MAG: tetratricopeptide repeat protein [Rhodoferax sp.]|nr:tetratricopeptide repeat protein [Rhodoferax sp.]
MEEKTLGPTHPDVAATLNNLAHPYGAMGRKPAALELEKRAKAIAGTSR